MATAEAARMVSKKSDELEYEAPDEEDQAMLHDQVACARWLHTRSLQETAETKAAIGEGPCASPCSCCTGDDDEPNAEAPSNESVESEEKVHFNRCARALPPDASLPPQSIHPWRRSC